MEQASNIVGVLARVHADALNEAVLVYQQLADTQEVHAFGFGECGSPSSARSCWSSERRRRPVPFGHDGRRDVGTSGRRRDGAMERTILASRAQRTSTRCGPPGQDRGRVLRDGAIRILISEAACTTKLRAMILV